MFTGDLPYRRLYGLEFRGKRMTDYLDNLGAVGKLVFRILG